MPVQGAPNPASAYIPLPGAHWQPSFVLALVPFFPPPRAIFSLGQSLIQPTGHCHKQLCWQHLGSSVRGCDSLTQLAGLPKKAISTAAEQQG